MSLPVAATQSPTLLLRQVIVRRRIRAIYQPIVDLEGGAPVVIKLDMSLVQQRGTSKETARVLNAVAAEAERSGATLLAEGIETDEHLARARAIGATLGQGWLFGRPGPLAPAPMTAAGVALRPAPAAPAGTPFELIADRRRVRRGDKRLLLALSRQLEAEAGGLGGEVVVLAAFQDARFFTTRSRDRYEQLALNAALVGALGAGMSEEPAPRVRGADLQRDEALHGSGTWSSSARISPARSSRAISATRASPTATAASTSSSPTSASWWRAPRTR